MLLDIIQNLCNNILKIDSKIRFVGIWYQNELIHESREGLEALLDKEKTYSSVKNAVIRWKARKKLGKLLGEPEFALAKYGKVYRITIQLTDTDLILVSTDIDCDIFSVLSEIQRLKEFLRIY